MDIWYLILVLILMWIFWSSPSPSTIRYSDKRFKQFIADETQMIDRRKQYRIQNGFDPVITTKSEGFFLK